MKRVFIPFLLSVLVFPVFGNTGQGVEKDIDAKILEFCTVKRATERFAPNLYHCFCTIKTHFVLADETGKNLVLEALNSKSWEPLNKVMVKSTKEVSNEIFMPKFDECFYSYCPKGFDSCK